MFSVLFNPNDINYLNTNYVVLFFKPTIEYIEVLEYKQNQVDVDFKPTIEYIGTRIQAESGRCRF